MLADCPFFVDAPEVEEMTTERKEDVCVEEGAADRKEGFVELERGEFEQFARQLCSNVTLLSPDALEQSLLEDDWWRGNSWRLIAKALYVQRQLLVEDGWYVRPFW